MHQSRARKPPETSRWKKKEGTCTPDQGSGATRGIFGCTLQNLVCANTQKLQKDLTSHKNKTWFLHNNIWKIKTKTKRNTQLNAVKAARRMPHPPNGHTLQTTIPKPYPRLALVPNPLIRDCKIVIYARIITNYILYYYVTQFISLFPIFSLH